MSGHFEAKKIAWRQTKDGLVLALAVHPDEMPKEMALSAINTRYVIAFSEIGDDEQPVDPIDKRFPNGITPQRTPFLDKVQAEGQAPEGGGSPKSSKPFSSLPLSQQAAIRCQDNDFKLFLDASNAEDAAVKVREYCGVTSRTKLDDHQLFEARHLWHELMTGYEAYLTTQRYAGSRR